MTTDFLLGAEKHSGPTPNAQTQNAKKPNAKKDGPRATLAATPQVRRQPARRSRCRRKVQGGRAGCLARAVRQARNGSTSQCGSSVIQSRVQASAASIRANRAIGIVDAAAGRENDRAHAPH
jgi:hypothetical protein